MTFDWDTVQDGLGNAAAVPSLVASLASAKKHERTSAFVALADERLVHQGTVWPAAPLAVPLLAESLRAPKHPGRALVIALLATIAVGEPIAYLRSWLGRPEIDALAGGAGVEGEAFRAVRAFAPDLEARLRDRSWEVRTQAAVALALVDPERAGAKLVDRLDVEPDVGVRVTLWLSLGLATRLGSVAAIPRLGASSADAERAAHAIAQVFAGAGSDEAAIALALTEPIVQQPVPFGRLGDVAIGAALAMGEAGHHLLARTLPTVAPQHRPFFALALIQAAFPRATQGPSDVALIPSSRLPALTLATIRLVAGVAPERLWAPLSYLPSVGVTRWLPDLRRFVGLDPPGPFERLVEWRGERVEVIVVLDAVARGEVPEEDGRAALLAGAGVVEATELALVASSDAYLTLHTRQGWTPERAIAFAASLLPSPDVVPHLLARVAEGKPLGYAAWVVVSGLLQHASAEAFASERLPAMLAASIPTMRGEAMISLARRCLERIRSEARDAVLREVPLPDAIEHAPRIRGVLVPPAFSGWSVIDVAADRAMAAARAVNAVAAWTRSDDTADGHPIDAAERAMIALRPESRVAIEAALPSATEYGRSVLEPLARSSLARPRSSR